MKCTPRFALASTLLVTSFMLMGCGSTSTPNSAVSEAAFTPTSPERNNAIRTLAIERKVPVVNARALLARLKAKGYKTRAERRGPVQVQAAVGTGSISDPELPMLMQAPEVSVEFTADDGSTELIGYENLNGLVVVDDDHATLPSSEIADYVLEYQADFQDGIVHNPPSPGDGGGYTQPVEPRWPPLAASSLSQQSSIGRRGWFCTARFFWCWAWAYNNPVWPEKTIYYQIEKFTGINIVGGFSNEQAGHIRDAIGMWNADIDAYRQRTGTNAGIKWVEGYSPNPGIPTVDFVRTRTGLFSGLAPVGYMFQKLSSGVVFLNQNEWDRYDSAGPNLKSFYLESIKALTIHEMGHVVGLNHEHQRCDRNKYVTVTLPYWQQLINPFNTNTLCYWGEDIGKFNYSSIMIYAESQGFRPNYDTPGTYYTAYAGDPNNMKYLMTTRLDKLDIQDGLNSLYP